MARERRGDLRVEHRLHHADGRQQHFEVLAGGVHDLHAAGCAEQRREHRQIGNGERIDARGAVAGGDLQQAQFRAIGFLAHEFGVERQRRRARGLVRESCQRIGSIDHQGRRSPGDVYNRPGIMLVNLRALLVRLIDIVLLRGGPEQLPASPGLLAMIVAVNVAVSAIIMRSFPQRRKTWQLQLLVGTVVALLWFRAGVRARQEARALRADHRSRSSASPRCSCPRSLPLVVDACCLTSRSPDPAVPPPAALSLLGRRARHLAADRLGAHRARGVRVAHTSPPSLSSSA